MWNTSLVPIQWAKPHDATKMPQLLCVKLEEPKKITSQALRRSRAVIHLDFSTSEHIAYEPFTTAELESAINSLKSVSGGPDAIHNNMLLRLPAVALEALLAVFNSLWESGVFPDAWREATVIPILKPGKSGLDPLHYRPISLTSSLCKLMERMANVR